MSLAVRSPVVASAAVQPHRARSVAAPSPLARKLAAGAAALLLAAPVSFAASLPTEVVAEKVLCDAVCVSKLDGVALQTTPSGLTYKDIIVGDGPSPELGFQVVVDYVAMTDSYRVFDNSLAAGKARGDGAVRLSAANRAGSLTTSAWSLTTRSRPRLLA